MGNRQAMVDQMKSWKGIKEGTSGHKNILKIYNEHKPLPQGYKVKPTDNWCAATASAAAMASGNSDIFPIECSCGRMIEKAKKMSIWIENDAYRPQPGDAILYDWGDSGKGDDTGWPEHVGIVIAVNGDKMTILEGNKDNAVGQRTVSINGKFIRGFIAPKYQGATTASKPEPAPQTAPAGVTPIEPADGAVYKKGSKGGQVAWIQNKVGATPDGSFGPDTEKKVKAWQAAHGLVADGSVGPKTIAAMKGKAAAAPAKRIGVVNERRGVNVRKGPGKSHGILYAIANGTKVEITEEKSGWYHIKVTGRASGWACADFIRA